MFYNLGARYPFRGTLGDTFLTQFRRRKAGTDQANIPFYENTVKVKIFTKTLKNANGLIKMIRMDMSTGYKKG